MCLGNTSSFYKNFIVKFFLVITVIMGSGHYTQTINSPITKLLFVAAGIVAVPVLLEYKRRINIYNGSFLLFGIMIALTLVINFGSAAYTYAILFLTIFVAFGITYIYSFDDVVSLYLKIMTFVSACGLVGYLLVNNTNFLNFLPEALNANGIMYKTGFIFCYLAYVPDRNCGMFWEPGLFATHLIFALIFETIFKKGKMSWARVILFSANIITTNSAAGILLFLFAIAAIYTRDRGNGIDKYRMVVSIFVLTIVVIIFLNLEAIVTSSIFGGNEYLLKLLPEYMQNSSRNLAWMHNMSYFLKSPLFGVGFMTMFENMKYVADTSTSTYLLAVFGVLGSFYTIYLIYGVLKIRQKSFLTKLFLVIIVIAIVNKEPHQNFLFTWMLLFYLLKNSVNVYDKNNCLEE